MTKTSKSAEKKLRKGEKVGAAGRVVPLSEDERKVRNWTKEQCLRHLREIAEAHPDQVISRNFFRVHSDISESTWNRYFGTFHEFKRQAGIILSRHAHRLEKSIAQHAAHDTIQAMNAQKSEYAGKYKRDKDKRWQIALVGSDIHDIDCCPFYRRMFVEAAKRAQPDVIVLGGDVFDLPEFSKYDQDPREWEPLTRIRWVHTFLRDLRENCPDAEIIFVEGNHEFRFLRNLAEATPALRTVLADLHGFTVPSLLGLDEFEINYVAPADLKAWNQADIKKELRRNWATILGSFIVHHFPDGFSMGYPGCNGHHHKHLVRNGYSPIFGSYEWHQLGSGHKRSAPYCNGEKWSNGFMLAHVDTVNRLTSFEYVDTTHNHAVLGGQIYFRKQEEIS